MSWWHGINDFDDCMLVGIAAGALLAGVWELYIAIKSWKGE